LLDGAVAAGANAKRVANLILSHCRRLANERRLDAKSVAHASAAARALLAEWLRAGWCVQPGNRFDDDGESP